MPGNVLTRSTQTAIDSQPAALVVAVRKGSNEASRTTGTDQIPDQPGTLAADCDNRPALTRSTIERATDDHEGSAWRSGNFARSASDRGRIVFHGCNQILLGGVQRRSQAEKKRRNHCQPEMNAKTTASGRVSKVTRLA